MSLRVHKVIGYGLSDITLNSDGNIEDERFDPKGYLFDPVIGSDRYGIDNFYDRLIERDMDKWSVELYSIGCHTPPLSSCVHFGAVEKKGVLLLCPPNKAHCWCREDDVIDFCEESALFDQRDHVKYFEGGIPSYRYLMDRRTGRRVMTTLAQEFFKVLNVYQGSGLCEAEKMGLETTLLSLASDMRFGSIEDAAENIVPLVPEIVSEFCEFLRVFKKRETVWTLRPMLYSYWS